MGQQQILLIVLGIIIVGIGIVIGINVFTATAADAKRDNVINDLIHLASEAQKYYKTPSSMGGGSQSFTGWKIPFQLTTNADGSFIISEAGTKAQVVITGTGNEVVTANDSVKVKITVFPSDFAITIIN
jgi:Tfp pilus assembly protein PilE